MIHARQCTACGAGMNEGYVIEGANERYCSDECLHKNITPDEFAEFYIGNKDDDDDDIGDIGDIGDIQIYWTEWEEEEAA